jgi:hypothetical protein
MSVIMPAPSLLDVDHGLENLVAHADDARARLEAALMLLPMTSSSAWLVRSPLTADESARRMVRSSSGEALVASPLNWWLRRRR